MKLLIQSRRDQVAPLKSSVTVDVDRVFKLMSPKGTWDKFDECDVTIAGLNETLGRKRLRREPLYDT